VILEHGRVLTLDRAQPSGAAVAVTRDGVVARGVEAWEGDRSAVSDERVELGGRWVVPGLVATGLRFGAWAAGREGAPADPIEVLASAQTAAHAAGLTGVLDVDDAGGFGRWQELDADRRRTLRVVAVRPASALDALVAAELRTGFGGRSLRLGPVRI